MSKDRGTPTDQVAQMASGGSTSSSGRCTVPVMMTGAVTNTDRWNCSGCQARPCRCPNARRSRLIRSALEGRLSLTVRFPPDARGTIADWKVQMRSDDAAACFDPVLSVVGWIKANLGDPDLTLLPVESAALPLPVLTSHRVVQQ